MVYVRSLVLSLIFVLSGCAQPELGTEWTRVEIPDGHGSFQFPCKPDKPTRLLSGAVYTFSCETMDMRATGSFKTHLDPYNQQTAEKAFQATELSLRNTFGEVQELKEDSSTTNDAELRDYTLRLKSGSQIRERIIVTHYGIYDAMIGTKKVADDPSFGPIADKFLKSVEANKS